MYMHLQLTSADEIPTKAIPEVVEHTVAMLLESREKNEWEDNLYTAYTNFYIVILHVIDKFQIKTMFVQSV